MQASLVSIGVPNYNYANYIVETLNSIVNQNYSHIEVIIVDDASTDDSIAVIEDWIRLYKGPLKIIFVKNEKNLGLPGTCNVILQQANGKYFQVLDADDVIFPRKIEKQVALLETNQYCALVYSDMSMIDENGQIIKESYLEHIGYDANNMPQGKVFDALFKFNFIPLPTVLVNTALVTEMGGFDASLQVQDYYLWLRLAKNNPFLYLPEKTALYRVHPASMSGSNLTNPRSVASVLQIKFSYYKQLPKALKMIVKKNIHNSSTYLYEFNYPNVSYWLKKDMLLNLGIKSFIYFFAQKAGIPYSFFTKLKKVLKPVIK